MDPKNQTLFKGIVYAVIGFACFGVSDSAAKYMISNGYPLFQVLLFNGIFGALSMLYYRRLYPGGRSFFGTPKLRMHLLRALFIVTGVIALVYALPRMTLVNFYAILFLAPIMICVLSAIILKEIIRFVRWITIIVAFGGVMIMLNPTAESFTLDAGILAAFWSAFALAMGMIMVKMIGQEANKARLAFIPNILLIPAALIGLVTTSHIVMPDSIWIFGLFILSGVAIGSGLLFVSLAYDTAPPSTIAPYEYTLAIWGTLYGYFIFHETPKMNVYIGAVIVVICGLFILYRENYLAKHNMRHWK